MCVIETACSTVTVLFNKMTSKTGLYCINHLYVHTHEIGLHASREEETTSGQWVVGQEFQECFLYNTPLNWLGGIREPGWNTRQSKPTLGVPPSKTISCHILHVAGLYIFPWWNQIFPLVKMTECRSEDTVFLGLLHFISTRISNKAAWYIFCSLFSSLRHIIGYFI